jgi:hypothetical protein
MGDDHMNAERWGLIVVFLLIAGLFGVTAHVAAINPSQTSEPTPTPTGHTATDAELAAAQAEWRQSAHADTFDNGLGADTTCARCKSPLNWDPTQELAAQQALDCGSCKRTPGEERPILSAGIQVAKAEWRNISCEVCHIPVGDSFDTGLAFWNQRSGRYDAVETVTELCARCHEGRHGFEVLAEQEASQVHEEMTCTDCHGSHGTPSSCTDCHDPLDGSGSFEHERHPGVNCTACHDAGNLSIWQDPDADSPHYGEYVTRRFAHTLTSWPSHNLSSAVKCQRCHHPVGDKGAAIVASVGCYQCHEHAYGAVSEWCIFFERDANPHATSTSNP